MKTLIVITMLSTLMGVNAFNPPPLREGPGEGAEQQERAFEPVGSVVKRATLPLPLPQGRGVVNDPAETRTTFATIDITLDPLGEPLGAYQFEITSPDATFTVVGVEAGGHPAFDHGRPPYFDRVAQDNATDHLIIGEYALPTLDAEQLPTKPVRIAAVHVVFDRPAGADELPELELTLTTAGDADGNKIEAKLSHTLLIPERPE